MLGDKGIEKHVLLDIRVEPEIEAGDHQGKWLQRTEAEGDGGIEEEIVVVARIVERLEHDGLAGRRCLTVRSKRAEERHQLTKIDGCAEVPL